MRQGGGRTSGVRKAPKPGPSVAPKRVYALGVRSGVGRQAPWSGTRPRRPASSGAGFGEGNADGVTVRWRRSTRSYARSGDGDVAESGGVASSSGAVPNQRKALVGAGGDRLGVPPKPAPRP